MRCAVVGGDVKNAECDVAFAECDVGFAECDARPPAPGRRLWTNATLGDSRVALGEPPVALGEGETDAVRPERQRPTLNDETRTGASNTRYTSFLPDAPRRDAVTSA